MSFIKDTFDDITGRSQRDAVREGQAQQEDFMRQAMAQMQQGQDQAMGYYQPFESIIPRAIESTNFLGDPQAQFEYLQTNPLFQLALDNANGQTDRMAAARGRLSTGDTLQQLSNNVLLSASPLLNQQRQDIHSLMGYGLGTANAQANTVMNTSNNLAGMLGGIGDSRAAGTIGAANAMSQGTNNLLSGLTFGYNFGQDNGWWGNNGGQQ